VPRRQWHELPSRVHTAVEEHTGAVLRARPVLAGSVSDLVAILTTERGEFFCKAITVNNPLVWMHRNEVRLNGLLPPIAPRLRWHVESGGWLLLGFDVVPGRHADLSAGSPDLPLLAATLAELTARLTPCPTSHVQPATVRWAGRVADEVVDGDTLLHTDITPRNFLVDGNRVAVVDWSMPCRGAPWIDTARMIIRLILAGHTPAEAEAWASTIPAWSAARPAAVDAFAPALARLARERAGRPSAPLADAAARWSAHRTGGRKHRAVAGWR
jgi:hypothetical protein